MLTKIATQRSAIPMRDFHDLTAIAGLWKSIAASGRAIGVKEGTMRAYVTGIRPFPADLIDPFVRAAQARPGGEGVTHELVCRLIAETAGREAA